MNTIHEIIVLVNFFLAGATVSSLATCVFIIKTVAKSKGGMKNE